MKLFTSSFIDVAMTGLGTVGPHLFHSSVSLLHDHRHTFEKHTSSHFTSNYVILEHAGVLMGMRNWIQVRGLRGKDNSRSLTKQNANVYPWTVFFISMCPHLYLFPQKFVAIAMNNKCRSSSLIRKKKGNMGGNDCKSLNNFLMDLHK